MSAQQILESKGYDNSDCIDILSAGLPNQESLDIQVRNKYGVSSEPLHLWESYYVGDADQDHLLEAAKKHGFDDVDDLLCQMDRDLIELAENVPAK